MAQNQITYNDKSDNVPVVNRDLQATAADFQDIKDTVGNNADDVTDRFRQVAVDLVAAIDYSQPNLHTQTAAIPRITQLRTSDGVAILDAYIAVNQSTGITTINVGANYTNAIFISIGW